MRRLIFLAVAALLIGSPACKRKRHPNPMATIEEESALASVVSMADPAASSQLLSGFHAVEDNAWRWSMKKFTVSLAVPPAAAAQGGSLKLKLTLPDVIADRMRGVSVTASIGDRKLGSFVVAQTGDHVAAFDVPAQLLNASAIIAGFELDKAIAPQTQDSRELGLIIAKVSLEPK
jgi:hypothetical protein